MNLDWFKNKKIFITGHTGFKGSWLCMILSEAGADITGYALKPSKSHSLFSIAEIDKKIKSIEGDIRDLDRLQSAAAGCQPDIVIHMAAQPLVRESYKNPVYTYETNVMGTVNICECVRQNPCVKSFLNVTTDKVYANREWEWGYREIDALDGYDPYSNSKSCSELVTHSYLRSFFSDSRTAISTARAGNVIGGGDFSEDRIIPDCVRAALEGKKIVVRNPESIRPYQHVLDPLFAYLMIVQKQYGDKRREGCYNVGPDEKSCITTGKLVDLFCNAWGKGIGWAAQENNGPHEAGFLKLDCSKLKKDFAWKPKWDIAEAVEKTVEWTKVWSNHPEQSGDCMKHQIKEFIENEG